MARGRSMLGVAGAVLVLVTAASAIDIPITWKIPSNLKPYPTTYINVGDSLTFNWQSLHGVYLLANGPNVPCPAAFEDSSPADLAPAAPGGSYTWTAKAPGIYNIACQVAEHCVEGMKIEIIVGSGPALAPGAEAPMVPALAPASTTGPGSDDGGSEGSD